MSCVICGTNCTECNEIIGEQSSTLPKENVEEIHKFTFHKDTCWCGFPSPWKRTKEEQLENHPYAYHWKDVTCVRCLNARKTGCSRLQHKKIQKKINELQNRIDAALEMSHKLEHPDYKISSIIKILKGE